MDYFYHPLINTPFSLGIALPRDYGSYRVDGKINPANVTWNGKMGLCITSLHLEDVFLLIYSDEAVYGIKWWVEVTPRLDLLSVQLRGGEGERVQEPSRGNAALPRSNAVQRLDLGNGKGSTSPKMWSGSRQQPELQEMYVTLRMLTLTDNPLKQDDRTNPIYLQAHGMDKMDHFSHVCKDKTNHFFFNAVKNRHV